MLHQRRRQFRAGHVEHVGALGAQGFVGVGALFDVLRERADANRIGEVWDGASPTMKRLVSKDEFVKQVTMDRNRLGAPAGRGQAGVSRSQFAAGGQVPAGLYINVSFPTKFAKAPQQVRELVSFHLDDDKTWRVSGYSLR